VRRGAAAAPGTCHTDAVSWIQQWLRGGAHAISPTAHYTGQVWARHGLGEPRLSTTTGRLLHTLVEPAMVASRLVGGPTLEDFLLARHRIIDHLLEQAVAAGEVTQVVELACGMSPRGLAFTGRHPDLLYIEVDLPGMAAHKQQVLDSIRLPHDRHRVEAADVMTGVQLSRIFSGLDRAAGVAVVTEGLLSYFPRSEVVELWRRIAHELHRFPHGRYLSDLHVLSEAGRVDRAFTLALGTAVRGRVHLHFQDVSEARGTLLAADFDQATLWAPGELAGRLPGMDAAGADRVRVVDAVTGTRAD
jgi:O-methyltransferase involved in polyketide biosynthesis